MGSGGHWIAGLALFVSAPALAQADDGYARGAVYPDGGARPKGGVQRGSVSDTTVYVAKTLPGVREAIEERRFADAQIYIGRTATALVAFADRLEAARRTLDHGLR